MLLRISLVVAILAGLATLFFSHTKVADRIATLTTERDTAQGAQRTAEEAQHKAEKERRLAKEELDKANKNLDAKSAALDAATTKLAEQQKRANEDSEKLTKVTGELNDAQTELASWKALGVTVEQIKNAKDNLAKSNQERDAFADENKILLRRNTELASELSRYKGEEIEPKMPPVRGKVLTVDPKYDFVVLNVGGNQGIVQNGRLLVDRDGKLVAKLRITKVEPNRSIANILPDWKQTEVMEGDQVLN
jgi:Skp family chaperone for outer membrane proteins